MDRIVAGAAVNPVGATFSIDRIIALAAVDRVIEKARAYSVVSRKPTHDVRFDMPLMNIGWWTVPMVWDTLP